LLQLAVDERAPRGIGDLPLYFLAQPRQVAPHGGKANGIALPGFGIL
jgi:hypothetical protein